jgi:hypothetical protein
MRGSEGEVTAGERFFLQSFAMLSAGIEVMSAGFADGRSALL